MACLPAYAHTLEDADSIDFMTEEEFEQKSSEATQLLPAEQFFIPKKIERITVRGSRLIPENAIRARIPYVIGELFKPQKTAQLIRGLYPLGFRSITVMGNDLSSDTMELIIDVEEKKKITEIIITNNNNVSKEEIEKKLTISRITTLDEEELETLAEQIKKLYEDKNFHNVIIETHLEPIDDARAIAHLTIQEGKKTIVKRVFFKGNTHFPSRVLRKLIFTKEDWILGFMDRAGTYHKDALEFDKQTLEKFYQNNGFLAATVHDMQVVIDEITKEAMVTFTIQEGDLYTVSTVEAPGNDVLTEAELLARIPIKPGMIYSKEMIRDTMEQLRLLWGEHGYISAEIDPSVLPDQQTKTVKIIFYSDPGDKVFLNRINIIGNKKTQDKVIRRKILLDEGELLTVHKMNVSKQLVEQLGFFDPRAGVNWRTRKLNKELADLDLIVKEIPTGKAFAQISYGGSGEDIKSPQKAIKISATVEDVNFMGSGVQYKLNGGYSKQDKSINFALIDPFLFDRPLIGMFNVTHGRRTYDEFNHNVANVPTEEFTGVNGSLGFTHPAIPRTSFTVDGGYSKIHFNAVHTLPMASQHLTETFQKLLRRRFISGTLVWVGTNITQNYLNNPFNPSRGYMWSWATKYAVPHTHDCFGFFKTEVQAQWLTPLINEYDLVLRLHGRAGFIKEFRHFSIPYSELYNIGGPASVRGFIFGEIGPQFLNDPIGGKKAFFGGAELIFPITYDFSIRGVFFYDGGAGWDTPGAAELEPQLRNNAFRFRHAIGFGVRLNNPAPVRIDIGFKLDPNRRLGESTSEVHFTMAQEFA